MRLLFVVQRYGREVAGGAELHCRQFATRLAERGHQVEALTSCAIGYTHWANEYPSGDERLDGVLVHRLETIRERDTSVFGGLDRRTALSDGVRPALLQRAWMAAQGPLLPGLVPWLVGRAAGFDAVIFFTYLYYTTWAGLPAAAGRTATVLHPTAHREPQLGLSLYDFTLRLPTCYAYSTEEEAELIAERTGRVRRGGVVGIGVDLDARGDGDAFRRWAGLGERPYLLFVGRVVAEKGWRELSEWFLAYKGRRPGPLALVVVGDALDDVIDHPDIRITGFAPEQTKRDALAGAVALVQPSYFESFSMILSEAWAQAVPAVVQGRCDVLAGQARRSGGAIPYEGYAEFEAALDMLLADPDLTERLGRAGRRHVDQHYAWNAVMTRYERLVGRAGAEWRHRTAGPGHGSLDGGDRTDRVPASPTMT
jgi:glycosyltransferase involved in cell wall biosynthesis